jgi:hypothetical protein
MASKPPTVENRTRGPEPLWSNRILLVLTLTVFMPVGVSVLYTFPPTEYKFFPGCWFHWMTGLHCPGCGATRSLHALLHGNIEQALAWNPLFVLLSPWLAYGCLRTAYWMWTGRIAPGPGLSANGTWILLGVLLAYWVIRNIDVYPLNLLAPHAVVGTGW